MLTICQNKPVGMTFEFWERFLKKKKRGCSRQFLNRFLTVPLDFMLIFPDFWLNGKQPRSQE